MARHLAVATSQPNPPTGLSDLRGKLDEQEDSWLDPISTTIIEHRRWFLGPIAPSHDVNKLHVDANVGTTSLLRFVNRDRGTT